MKSKAIINSRENKKPRLERQRNYIAVCALNGIEVINTVESSQNYGRAI
jgi:hypothetical protein